MTSDSFKDSAIHFPRSRLSHNLSEIKDLMSIYQPLAYPLQHGLKQPIYFLKLVDVMDHKYAANKSSELVFLIPVMVYKF